MRSGPIFQPALSSLRSIPVKQACHDGLTFAAHYPADDFSLALASGDARLELWTDLPVFQSNRADASASRATTWNAVQLQPLKAKLGRNGGYSFATRVKCSPTAVDGAYGFTYRIVHPDGKIDWIGSPSNDGQIKLPPPNNTPFTIPRLVQPRHDSSIETRIAHSTQNGEDDTFAVASLVGPRGGQSSRPSFSIQSSDVQSGLVVERTKSTWCSSRRFRSLTEVSPSFGCNLLVLELAQSDRQEVLVLMPVFDDSAVTSRLVRGSCMGDTVNFEFQGADQSQAKVAFALGTIDKLEQTIRACRSQAARSLRAPIHEPLGIGWSAKKLLDSDSSQSLSLDVIMPSVPYDYTESDCGDFSFCSDSTAVDSADPILSADNSILLPMRDEASTTGEHDDALTESGDHTIQDTRTSPLQPTNGLGFCTWEAMQNEKRRPFLSEVVAALAAAEERLGQGAITALLIDDGWQDVVQSADDRGRLNSFDMDSTMLDLDESAECVEGEHESVLARYVSHIRRRFPSIRSVGCRMTLAGTWDGIHPDGPIAAGLSAPLRRVRVEDPFRHASRDWYIQSTDLDMHLFWDRAFHSLRQSGIEFVKIDAQAEWEWICDQEPQPKIGRDGAALGKAAFESMEGAATRYFGAGGGVIHCMDFTATLTNTSRTLHNQGMTIRTTDNFFPLVPEAHRHHLAHNVYNSLLLPEHRCDADILSHCSTEHPWQDLDYTGFHASFRAFTDARLWMSGKAGEPGHGSLRALVSPPALSGEATRVSVQARGHLLPEAVFDDLISDGTGSALKLRVRHESIGGATLGLWNLRGRHAATFDTLNVQQLLGQQASGESYFRPQKHYAVSGFGSGKLWLLASEEAAGDMLSISLEAASWEVLTVSPLLTTSVDGVSVALLGSSEHFMTPEGVHSVTMSISYPARPGRHRRTSSKFRRPTHHRRRSSRMSTFSDAGSISISSDSSAQSAIITTAVDNLVENSSSGSQAVLLSLALVNGFFSMVHSTVTGSDRFSRIDMARRDRKAKHNARFDFVEAMVSVLDQLQTLAVFAVLIVASWTSMVPPPSEQHSIAAFLPSWGKKRIEGGSDSKRNSLDEQAFKRVRLSTEDAVATLKRCLSSGSIEPLRECPITLAKSPSSSSSLDLTQAPTQSLVNEEAQPPSPLMPRSELATAAEEPDVVVTALIDMATKISFLVLCPSEASIRTCTIDRTAHDCASTPWIKVESVSLEEGSAEVGGKSGGAFRLEVDMKAWYESQAVTYVETLSAPVSLAIRISASP